MVLLVLCSEFITGRHRDHMVVTCQASALPSVLVMCILKFELPLAIFEACYQKVHEQLDLLLSGQSLLYWD